MKKITENPRIKVSERCKEIIQNEAKRLKKPTQKQYVEECIGFFSEYGLDPAKYKPSHREEIRTSMQQEFAKISEQFLQTVDPLGHVLYESKRAGIYQEIILELLTLHMSNNEDDYQYMQKENNKMLQQRLQRDLGALIRKEPK